MVPVLLIILVLLCVPESVDASQFNSGDSAWMLVCTVLVLFMTLPGLALFYSGLVRTKNVLSVMMQCFAIACLASVIWFFGVYELAFGDGSRLNQFIGFGQPISLGIGIDNLYDGRFPETVFFMFQMTFAIIAPALIIGGVVERIKFSAMLWFSGFWLVLVYAPVCHWIWGGGWLADFGFMDFAGGAVIHISAGISALVAAIVVGKRRGFPATMMLPHNMTLTFIGASMLWVGWFGFNAGSALAASKDAGMAMAVTHISAAVASLAWMACEWIRHGKPSILGILTGMVAGLGAITPASGYVGLSGGLFIGLIAGVSCYYATLYVKNTLKIDDSLDVFSVHGVGGILGLMLTALFHSSHFGGLQSESNYSIADQIGIQFLGVCVTFIWAGIISFVLLKFIDKFVGLRVHEEDEEEGLDIALHNERGYSI